MPQTPPAKTAGLSAAVRMVPTAAVVAGSAIGVAWFDALRGAGAGGQASGT